MMVARAARDFGVYVTDFAGSQAFFCEDDNGPAYAFAVALRGGTLSAHDPRIIFNALRVVSNNNSSNPNGGPLGAARRG
jgi:hypothetical protein